MAKKITKQELVKVLTGYDGCNDCNACPFKGCCAEEKIAEDLLELWNRDD